MKTVHWPVENARFNEPVQLSPPPNAKSETDSYSTLSTFHMPRTVDVAWAPGGECRIVFAYPNNEPPERRPRWFGDVDPSIRYLLGKHSRKVLELTIENAQPGQPFIEVAARKLSEAASRWLGDTPADTEFVARRNAQVVEAILVALALDVANRLLSVTGEHPIDVHAAAQRVPEGAHSHGRR